MYSLDNFLYYFDKFDAFGEFDEKGIEYCLERGADINTKNYKGETPFIQTCKYGSDTFLKKLLANDKIDLYLKDNKGYDGLMHAFKRCFYNVEIILNNDKFDINYKDSEGKTFFHHICCKYEEIIYEEKNSFLFNNYNKYLLEEYFRIFNTIKRKVNINIQDNEGYTPLMYAILNYLNNNYDIILFILDDNRIDIDLQNNKGETALDMLYSKQNYSYLRKDIFKHCSNKSVIDKLYQKHIDFLVKNKDKCIKDSSFYL